MVALRRESICKSEKLVRATKVVVGLYKRQLSLSCKSSSIIATVTYSTLRYCQQADYADDCLFQVMANVLCQIKGSKRVVLYPPSDVVHLKISPGGSSSSINIFEADPSTEPSLAATNPWETVLRPGDVLFIPPLWLHATSPLEHTSISINVFFRNLKTGYAAGRDVYGNRDVQAYEKGRKDIAKMAQTFDGLPAAMSRFYLERLAEELRQKAVSIAP